MISLPATINLSITKQFKDNGIEVLEFHREFVDECEKRGDEKTFIVNIDDLKKPVKFRQEYSNTLSCAVYTLWSYVLNRLCVTKVTLQKNKFRLVSITVGLLRQNKLSPKMFSKGQYCNIFWAR